jgi:hypothetical protein
MNSGGVPGWARELAAKAKIAKSARAAIPKARAPLDGNLPRQYENLCSIAFFIFDLPSKALRNIFGGSQGRASTPIPRRQAPCGQERVTMVWNESLQSGRNNLGEKPAVNYDPKRSFLQVKNS